MSNDNPIDFKPKIVSEIRDKKGRIVLKTIYHNGWYKIIANHYTDNEQR